MDFTKARKIISNIPTEKMKVIKTECRPPEKSNEILVASACGQDWYCERPRYKWSTLDQSFISSSYVSEISRVFPVKKTTIGGFFDTRGLWWSTYEMSSLFLVPYFVANPLQYLLHMTRRMADVQEVIDILYAVNRDKDDDSKLADNIMLLARAYKSFYLYMATVFMVFDELLHQFKLLLINYFDKKTANIYLTKFLQAEITRKVVENKFGQELVIEKPNSRGVLYARGSTPLVYYSRPLFFHQFSDDMDILEQLAKKKIKEEELKKFLSLRWIVPVAVQMNEEAQYVESQMLSAHTSFIMEKVAKKLQTSIDELERLTYRQIINRLNLKN